MFMPGFSSSRIPVQVRLFLAISVTLALAPIALPSLSKAVTELSPETGFYLLISEVTIGSLIGLMGRMFFLALDFMGTAIASFAGFSNLPGVPIENAEPNPTLAAMLTLTAVTLFFLADLHWEVLRGLLESYRVLPVSAGYDAQFGLTQFTDRMSEAFTLVLQISGPFIIYSISINFLFGVMNKFTPQIAVYFVSLPFVIFGGLIILYFTLADFMNIFMSAFGRWLVTG
jgi:flagellar biosynthetic protein FliR